MPLSVSREKKPPRKFINFYREDGEERKGRGMRVKGKRSGLWGQGLRDPVKVHWVIGLETEDRNLDGS